MKRMRNLFIFVLIGIIAIFAGERVDALDVQDGQCIYTWENVAGPVGGIESSKKTWKVTVTFDVSDRGVLSYVSDSAENTTCGDDPFDYCEPLTEQVRFAATDVSLRGGKCPNLLLYPEGTHYVIYKNTYECKFEQGGNNWCDNREISWPYNDEPFDNDTSGGSGNAYCSDRVKSEFADKLSGIEAELNEYYAHTQYVVTNGISLELPDELNTAANEFISQLEGLVSRTKTVIQKYADVPSCKNYHTDYLAYLATIEERYVNYNNSSGAMGAIKLEIDDKLSSLSNAYPLYERDISVVRERVETAFSDAYASLSDAFNAIKEAVNTNGCKFILGSLAEKIQQVLNVIKIAAPILLIFFGSLDFGKAVISNDDKAMNKAVGDFGKRVIAAVALFFVPWLIELIFSLPGLGGGFTDVLCGIGKVMFR